MEACLIMFSRQSVCVWFFFFFSSRRRHTRYWRDWSSDVCSSDLTGAGPRDPLQLFEAADRALGVKPSWLLVVDDLQWLDRTSVALLHYVVRAAESTGLPLLLFGAGRVGATTVRLGESLGTVLAADPGRLLRLALASLDPTAGAVLARSLGPDLDAVAVDRVVRRAGGIPFWIEVLSLERSRGGTAGAR